MLDAELKSGGEETEDKSLSSTSPSVVAGYTMVAIPESDWMAAMLIESAARDGGRRVRRLRRPNVLERDRGPCAFYINFPCRSDREIKPLQVHGGHQRSAE